MKFEIDKQTITDLELFEKNEDDKSIFSFFDYTKSIGGKKRLDFMFSRPSIDRSLLENRIDSIKYFQHNEYGFEINKESLYFIEHYLNQQNTPKKISFSNSFLKAIFYKIRPQNEYYIITRGIKFLLVLLKDLYAYADTIKQDEVPENIYHYKLLIEDIIENTPLKTVLEYKDRTKFYPNEFGKLDHCFRKVEINDIRELLETVYDIDALKAVAIAANKHGFSLPVFTSDDSCYQVYGLFHPFVENAICNDFEIADSKNICFLTGPNMAGKSTFLKAISTSIYLAHLGFPVPAKYMKTSIYNGLFTTINLSDNLNKGISHYYNEVLRVKYIAEQINEVGNIFVVFDELFRGTNVKDAYEASLSVISAFCTLEKGVFVISTHIIEIADKLKDKDTIFFKYFEANLEDDIPQYNYKIKDGVTDERIGMYILKKEKVIETIEMGSH
ncbi:MAG: hypothetical protein WCL51_13135 [Bacteroidota bacterium]